MLIAAINMYMIMSPPAGCPGLPFVNSPAFYKSTVPILFTPTPWSVRVWHCIRWKVIRLRCRRIIVFIRRAWVFIGMKLRRPLKFVSANITKLAAPIIRYVAAVIDSFRGAAIETASF